MILYNFPHSGLRTPRKELALGIPLARFALLRWGHSFSLVFFFDWMIPQTIA